MRFLKSFRRPLHIHLPVHLSQKKQRPFSQHTSRMKKITVKKITITDAPITEDQNCNSLHEKLSPGIDGFPVEYYKRYVDILAPILLKVYKEVFETSSVPDSFNSTLITLISEKDRDTSEPSNFRLVQLLGVDLKILTKTLVSWVEKV